MRAILAFFLLALPGTALAQAPEMRDIVEQHVLPRYEALAGSTAQLADAAQADCTPESEGLRHAYHEAFDAWVRVSHLRFGPSEAKDRAFALAFWPDSRGKTPKALARLIREEDPAVASQEGFASVSIAARGFYALEFLLYDPQFDGADNPAYHCLLVQALSRDIAGNSADILDDWQNGYADLLITTGNDSYRDDMEAARQLFTALATGLEFTSQARLGRPLGTFDKPRPRRAEARRSGRSLRHVALALEATRDLAARLSGNDKALDAAFAEALARVDALDDPALAGVATPQGHLRVEVIQQKIDRIREILDQDVAPRLGIAAGFNALDGD